jgi:hypothetical protein
MSSLKQYTHPNPKLGWHYQQVVMTPCHCQNRASYSFWGGGGGGSSVITGSNLPVMITPKDLSTAPSGSICRPEIQL